jgi:endonuclease/exonuclease/phosphatase family metal-dependent hydrolase
MDVAPLLKIYRLVDGRITIDTAAAAVYAARERLSRPEFDIDEPQVWDRVLSADEVRQSYARHFQPAPADDMQKRSSLTAAAWNIYHGGIHHTPEREGWDSRQIIAELIRRENIDIVMMQETYSTGDYIAAELGFCFATTIDWDNLNQGANISVLSRFPIEEVHVPPGSAFMNVAARIRLSETQDIWAMSNWYGMRNFPEVFAFHESRLAEADRVPILFGGDFNAVPHTDGGDSPASRQLAEAGFTDAFRHLHPDVDAHPGVTHDNGRRIDQLYFKGAGLTNTSTTVISTWPTRFPSDHYLIKSVFELENSTVDE